MHREVKYMDKYLKLKCIDCHYEQIMEVPADGTEGFLVTVKRGERKELNKMQEIARYNRLT